MASIVPINVTNILPPAININDWEFSNYTGIIKLTPLWIDKDVMKYLNYLLTTIITIYAPVSNFLKDSGYSRAARFEDIRN